MGALEGQLNSPNSKPCPLRSATYTAVLAKEISTLAPNLWETSSQRVIGFRPSRKVG